MVNKNFNQIIFLFKEAVYSIFSVKVKVYSTKFQQTFQKVLSLKFTTFFIAIFFLYIKKTWEWSCNFFHEEKGLYLSLRWSHQINLTDKMVFFAKNAIKIFLLNEHIQSKLTNKYCKTGVCKRVHSWKVDLSRPQIYIRGYSRSLFCVTIACNHLPFFKIFSSFVYFCTNFQIYFINISLPFFWKIPPMPLLYRPCISVIGNSRK